MDNTILILVFGFLFGLIIAYAKLNSYKVISGQATFSNNTVLKTILLTIGFGSILLSLLIGLGLAGFHIKPFVVWGVVLGGLIFGMAMSVLGYCPGTLPISAGEGALDAWGGIVGGLVGGWFYTLIFPFFKPIFQYNFGKIAFFNLFQSFHISYYIMVFIIGGLIIYLAVKIPIKVKTDKKWFISGVLLAVLNSIVFLKMTTNRPIGASTSYPYVADKISGLTASPYFQKIEVPGHWELIFLTGALLAGLILALIRKDFKLKINYNIRPVFDQTKNKRLWTAFIGGFMLIFGARLAGGCTSGHIISGGMQLAVSSLVFAIFVFVGMYIIEKLVKKFN
jgi:uncharacterized membrane protein YedE/YeeE